MNIVEHVSLLKSRESSGYMPRCGITVSSSSTILSGDKFYWLLFCWLPLLDVPFGSPLPLETKLCYWLCCAQHSCPHSVQLPCFPQWGKNNPSPLFHTGRHEPDDLVRLYYVLLDMYLSNVPLCTLPIWFWLAHELYTGLKWDQISRAGDNWINWDTKWEWIQGTTY